MREDGGIDARRSDFIRQSLKQAEAETSRIEALSIPPRPLRPAMHPIDRQGKTFRQHHHNISTGKK